MILLAAVFGSHRCPAQASSCEACHPKEAAAEKDRPHQRAGIDCVACHGGDPTAKTSDAAKRQSSGFRGAMTRTAWTELCGDCHADVRRMNPFGIPTDQLARYRTSRHGEDLFGKNDEHVAICIDCHGSHGILGPDSSDSPVYPRNVPDTCGKCHDHAEIIDEYGLDGDEEANYRASVHGDLLLKQGDLSAPQCATCHGSHGALPPGFARVSAVCGKCHVRQRELFEKSPHARLVESGDFDACVVCHSNHKVVPASDQILKGTCSLCHQPDSTPLQTRDLILSSLQQAQGQVDRAKERLATAQRRGLATEEEQVLLADARTALLQMEATQHTLDPERLQTSAREVASTVDRLGEQLDAATSLERIKRLALLPVIAFLVLMSLGSWVRFRRIHRSLEHPSHG